MNTSFTMVQNWFTDKIFFKVIDSANFATPPLFFFNENSISLRTKIILNKQMMPEHNEIIVEAIKISEENIDDSRFKIPDYKRVLTVEAYSKEILEKLKAVNSELNNKQ